MPEGLSPQEELTASQRVAALIGRINARATAETGVEVESVIAERTAAAVAARGPERERNLGRMAQRSEQDEWDRQQAATQLKLGTSATAPSVQTGIMI